MDFGELWAIFGPGVAGAVFGAGWWFWVDAVVCSAVKISFLHYLPGIFASLAALMFNCVRKEDIDYSPYDEGEWRLKLWLFIAYVVSFVSLAASVGLLIQDALMQTGPSAWTGVAGVLQCVFVLIRIAVSRVLERLKGSWIIVFFAGTTSSSSPINFSFEVESLRLLLIRSVLFLELRLVFGKP
nr:transmembrane protein 50 homolog [Ipomoea batatas]